MASQQTTKYQELNPKDLTMTKFEENERSNGQLLGYPRYKSDGAPLMLQGPWIKMISYGVPQLGQYYKSDKDRTFVKIPLDLSIPEIKEFHDKLQGIDAVFESKEFKTMQFGAKAAKYKYLPIVRSPAVDDNEDDEVDEKKNKYPRPAYIKIKLDVTWPESQVKTQVYTSIMKDGKREREKKDVSTVDEFASIVRFLSSIRPIIRPVKGWAEKKTRVGNDYMQYGITFKLVKVEVEPAEGGKNNLLGDYLNNDAFIDSDDEEAPSKFQGKPAEKANLPLINKKVVVEKKEEMQASEEEVSEDEKEEEESEEEEEEEEEEIPEPPKKGKGAKAPAAKTPATKRK
jgi:hypothetical protein